MNSWRRLPLSLRVKERLTRFLLLKSAREIKVLVKDPQQDVFVRFTVIIFLLICLKPVRKLTRKLFFLSHILKQDEFTFISNCFINPISSCPLSLVVYIAPQVTWQTISWSSCHESLHRHEKKLKENAIELIVDHRNLTVLCNEQDNLWAISRFFLSIQFQLNLKLFSCCIPRVVVYWDYFLDYMWFVSASLKTKVGSIELH